MREKLEKWAPVMISVTRIVVALIFMEHGTQKLFGFPPRPPGSNYPSLASLSGVGGFIEALITPFLLVGLFTREVAFILSGEMAVAYFVAYQPRALYPVVNGGDAAILYCFIFLLFVFIGGGTWSLDRALRHST